MFRAPTEYPMKLIFLPFVLVACSDKLDDTGMESGPEEVRGIAALGGYTHDIASVTMTEIGGASDGLKMPRDLAFSPAVDDELWVVSRTDDSATIFSGAGTDAQESRTVIDPYALHFMEEVSSVAFGAALFEGSDLPNFGTCHESMNTYNGWGEENEFMGPSLWSSDPDVFGESNPEAVEYWTSAYGQYTDLGSHIDMLHESPLCMGIAWETDNVYWVFNGLENAIDRVDFQEDHGVGWDDHNDGIVSQYVEGDVSRVPDVPSHLEMDATTAFLYIADTGNNAIKVLDTTTGTRGGNLYSEEPRVDHHNMDDAMMWTLIEGSEHDMVQPSGLAIVEDTLLITDHGTGVIHAFDLEGNPIDWLDTGLGEGALMGIIARSLDDIWVVDAKDDRVLRLQP
jgi:hypothetical protein